MRLYIITEGLFESYLYPEWLKLLLPEYHHITKVNDVEQYENCYYMFSSKGYNAGYYQMGIPAVYNTIINGLKDIANYGLYHKLIYLGDSENIPLANPHECIARRKNIIYNYIQENAEKKIKQLSESKLKLIIQHNCIETWLLGNKKIVRQNINDSDVLNLLSSYNIKNNDPENMTLDNVPEFIKDSIKTIPQFHKYYLRKIINLATKGQINTVNIKSSYKYFSNESYLSALRTRFITDSHIKSFGYFLKNTESLVNHNNQ